MSQDLVPEIDQVSPSFDSSQQQNQPTNQTKELSTLVASLPLWQRRYLALLQSGVPSDDALRYLRLTRATISVFTSPADRRYSATFARALGAVEAGAALVGVEEARAQASAWSAALVQDQASRSLAEPDLRKATGAARLVMEATGLVGQPTQVTQAVQMNFSVTAWEMAKAKEAARAEKAREGERPFPMPRPAKEEA